MELLRYDYTMTFNKVKYKSVFLETMLMNSSPSCRGIKQVATIVS